MRILIAEDDAISRRLLDAVLTNWDYEVLATHEGIEAWEMLSDDDPPNLAIIDWMMPGLDGVEICKRVRAMGERRGRYTYLILLTAKGQTQDIIEGMKAGADDYIIKPFEAGELKVRLRAARRVLDLEAKLLSVQDALRHQAMTDSLTGLWNRPAIFELLRKELARSKRDRSPVALIVVDIDHFKRVNDTYGHDGGDVVLRKVAETLRSNLRDYDFIGRHGGEEFLIVMPGCDVENAAARVDGIRAMVENAKIALSKASVSVTVSMGVATNAQLGTDEFDFLMHAADSAMYLAKDRGRNRVEVAVRAVQKQAET